MAGKRNRGLGSGIGTFTHTEYAPPWYKGWVRNLSDLRSLLKKLDCKIKEREMEVRKEYCAQQSVYCPICGESIPYKGETPMERGKRRKCDECRQVNRVAGTKKHCRQCGQAHYIASGQVWGTWAVCDKCLDPSPRERAVNEALQKDPELIQLRAHRNFLCGKA